MVAVRSKCYPQIKHVYTFKNTSYTSVRICELDIETSFIGVHPPAALL